MQISIGKNTTTNYLVILVRLFQGIYVTKNMPDKNAAQNLLLRTKTA